ncbi:lipocalin family protein [Salinimicrobium sp. GXAS 041]|uniref:lipocalin family protein n=1 Tax=Salinimicrobium sp. GXAS 041 TaxID=3400806 RepID=UPI003C749001
MKKVNFLFLLFIFSLGCNTQTSEEKIQNLNGYWEIKSVEQENENPTEYRFSEMVDYIEIKDGAGFRTKVKPQLDGSFISTENSEELSVQIENDSINLYYTTPYDSWKETLLSSEDDEIQLLNQYGTIYTYKRFSPYLTEDYGEEK